MSVTKKVESCGSTPVAEEGNNNVWKKEEIWNKEVDIDVKWIEFVDDNVLMSKPSPVQLDEAFELKLSRTPPRNQGQRHHGVWRKLLDKNRRDRNGASRWL